ncbi:ABC transporter permease [Ancylomarina euxinus]|uniref:ABC transporter permease n=1 Tax=Ancylomarina euxinus TaxID=2283627 RepID=A0A425XYQ1_9BACT|nr:ABC transporter permease [Ancylomarina euxinus]MCZ4695852.1 ABC transporter permease [Ancylomarina euxinus]MUP16084.1 FtsX-like permease family protein [Ancylomarina euxinus]RRG19878.1 ABC transporter permease [Ancylomarina euxinus]
MNLELFIAKKITYKNKSDRQISRPIISIATLGIALGLSVMILAIAIVTGFKAGITEKITGFGSHIQISNYDNNNSFETYPIDINLVPFDRLSQIEGIKHIQSFATKPGIIKTKEEIQGIVLSGAALDYDWSFFKDKLVEGDTISMVPSKKSNQVLISEKLAKLLHLNVGEKLIMYFVQQPIRQRAFTISGIYNSGMDEFDKLFVICDMRHIQKLNNWDDNQVSGIEITLDDFKNLDETKDLIRDNVTGIFTNDGSTFKVRSIKQRHPQIFNWLEMLDLNVWIILGLMILVAGFNMISGLLIIILEKTNMIGILKALGTDNWSVRKIFLYQSSMIIGKGMLWGNLIGIGICLMQYQLQIISLDPVNYYLDTVPINLNVFHLVLLNIGTLIATVSMLLVPSYWITRITPSKAIKFD